MPEAQTSPASPPRAGPASRRAGPRWGAVAGVDETLGRSVVEGIDMVEISQAVDDAQVDGRNQRLAGRSDRLGPRAQRVERRTESGGSRAED